MSTNNKSYPKEVFVSKKTTKDKTQAFSVVHALTWADDKPLTMPNLSRYIITGVDIWNAGGKTICIANLPAHEVPAIMDEYHEVMERENIRSLLGAAKNEDIWPKDEKVANICKMFAQSPKMGKNKGTPYYNISTQELIGYRDFLAKGVSQYPNNQKDIDVINTLLALDANNYNKCVAYMKSREAKLGSNGNSSSNISVVYDSGLKPKMSTKNANGQTLCYQLKITYDNEKNYPFRIEITNLYCDVERQTNGSLNTHPQTATDKNTVVVNLSKFDGRTFFHDMENDLMAYRNVSYAAQITKAEQIDKNNRIAAAQANQNSQYGQGQ